MAAPLSNTSVRERDFFPERPSCTQVYVRESTTRKIVHYISCAFLGIAVGSGVAAAILFSGGIAGAALLPIAIKVAILVGGGVFGGVLGIGCAALRRVPRNVEALQKKIKELQTSPHPILRCKAAIFEQALKQESSSQVRVFQGSSLPKDRQLLLENLSDTVPFSSPDFYGYGPTLGLTDYWVDFANRHLGGGCFTYGFVQEEIMVAEIPAFARLLADAESCGYSLLTRTGGERPGSGGPTPILMLGAKRVQVVDVRYYGGRGLDNWTRDSIATVLDSFQDVNLLAIAAPNLSEKDPKLQWDTKTLGDIFDTLAAGFTLVSEQHRNNSCLPPLIHSGKFGCGAFKNNYLAVYLLHVLASQLGGVAIQMHGYSEEEIAECELAWKALCPRLRQCKTLQECLTCIREYGLSRSDLSHPP